MTKKEYKEVKKILQLDKCPNCKKGVFNKCPQGPKAKKKAWIEDSVTGKRQYFCCMACAMLCLDQEHPGEKVFEQTIHGFVTGGLFQ